MEKMIEPFSSETVADIALYSASTLDFATVFWFLVFHETRDCPRKTQKPVKERALLLQVPQSASL